MKLRIGARGSHLARIQAAGAAARLERLGHEAEIVAISTAGDRSNAPSFAAIGPQGVFVREIEQALLDGRIDVAVHSHKDLPTASPAELVVAAAPARRDPSDALVARAGRIDPDRAGSLLPVREGAIIGTASVRRQVWIRHFRPDVRAAPLRGNVPTRIRRLREGGYDAILLATAGLERLRGGTSAGILGSAPGGRLGGDPAAGPAARPPADTPPLDLEGLEVIPLDPTVFVPAPAQGALAFQCRRSDRRVREALARLDHTSTREAVEAERALLARLEGGCELAFGAWCGHDPARNESVMVAMLERDGEVRRETARGASPPVLAERLWRALSGDSVNPDASDAAAEGAAGRRTGENP